MGRMRLRCVLFGSLENRDRAIRKITRHSKRVSVGLYRETVVDQQERNEMDKESPSTEGIQFYDLNTTIDFQRK